jgi:hypothetical protein
VLEENLHRFNVPGFRPGKAPDDKLASGLASLCYHHPATGPVLMLVLILALAASLRAAPAGALNASEGEARISGNHVITGSGMAEVLLTPGCFLRVGEQSEATLDRVGTGEARLRLDSGEALLEVIDSAAPIVIEQGVATVTLRQAGLYGFGNGVVRIYAGQAEFTNGTRQTIAGAGSTVRLRGLRKTVLTPAPEDRLFSWSRLRSAQLSAGECCGSGRPQRRQRVGSSVDLERLVRFLHLPRGLGRNERTF